jgi:hypothetical protein
MSTTWQGILNPTMEVHHRARTVVNRVWDDYRDVAEKGFLGQLQSEGSGPQRWWEMYFWHRLLSRGLTPSHPGPSMPDAAVRWRDRVVYFECVSPTAGVGENAIPEAPEGKAYKIPTDEMTLRITSAVRDKMLQAQDRATRTRNCPYVVAVDVSQLGMLGFNEDLCAASVYPIGMPQVTLFREPDRPPEWSHAYRPMIERDGRAPISTSAFLGTKDFSAVSAVLFCSAALSGVTDGWEPPFVVVHNHHAQSSLSRKLFRDCLQFEWNGYSTLVARKPNPMAWNTGIADRA